MKSLFTVATIISATFIVGCVNQVKQTQSNALSGVTLPMEYTDRGHAYISVDLGQVKDHPMILDTAATIGALPAEVKPKLNLDKHELIITQVQGAVGKVDMELLYLSSTTYAGNTLESLPYIFQNLSSLTLENGKTPGILGQGFLSPHCVSFDFISDKLSLNKKGCDQNVTQGLKSVSFNIDRDFIVLETYFNGEKVDAILDTGAPESYMNSSLHKLVGVEVGQPEEAKGLTSQATPKRKLAKFDYYLGEYKIEDDNAYLADLPVFTALGYKDKPLLLLGLSYFKKGKLVIDYEAKKLYF
jgi:predicted aspartyl protease